MSGKDIKALKQNLPSTTNGGRMHTCLYARAVSERVKKEVKEVEPVAKIGEDNHQQKNKKIKKR